ncbi:virulence-associated E family protein [Paenibacillus senegalensis]|uniref:virulence-associated E family protein n=1 Tax=Paenibacillus senegalensis TaxID=1465766 RepID=UPI000287B6CD|nr:virulence-associated E family protein [Paenibacillus senegalensis]
MLEISFGRNRSDKHWKNEYLEWEEFVQRLRKVRRTTETMAQYDRQTKAKQFDIKDGPAFVGGSIRGGRRKKENIECRWLITLDVDHADEDFQLAADLVLGGSAYLLYSTHSHRPNKPKYRLIAPVDREMDQDEYAAVSRKLADQIGLDFFDKTTFEVQRLMYMPSCSQDAEPVFEVFEGEPISVDSILDEYDDWKDVSSWPRHEDEKTAEGLFGKKPQDPTDKPGLIGVFCRTYSIDEGIEKFLSDQYEPGTMPNRYTYIDGSSANGLEVFPDQGLAYSHQESDPVSDGRSHNLFDLIRIHRYRDLDDNLKEKTPANKHPSYLAMLEFASNDSEVKKAKLSELIDEFDELELEEDDDWQAKLDTHNKTGDVLPTAKNAELILRNGEFKGVLGYDSFGNTEVIRGALPWRGRERPHRRYEPWLGADDKRLQHYFGKRYGFSTASTIQNAFTEVVHMNKFHPIKEFIEGGKWDGEKRAERIFITYLGADDSHYVRQVTRKMLLAAVRRLYEPGCKFDQMLVLVGPQGAGKSSILAKLGREWFSDSLRTFENKEAGEHLQSGWLFEIGELSAMKKTEVEEVKAFLSKTEDRYRVAYDRQVSDFPRKCVFFGTTNTKEFLRDTTGNRRFWPVEVVPDRAEKSHWDDMGDYEVSQIWAEVLCWYKAAEALELDSKARKAAEEQQAAHLETDSREGIIRDWLDAEDFDTSGESIGQRQRVCAAQVWTECLGNKKGSMQPWDAKPILDILNNSPGWVRRKNRAKVPGYGLQTVFERDEF